MTNTPQDAAEIVTRLHRLTGLTSDQIAGLSLTLDPVQVDQISDSALAALVNGTLPGLPINPAGGLPLGLPGATSGARFVGGTASGPPSTGTFQARDYVLDGAGVFWICTVGGSPGTWVDAASADALSVIPTATPVKTGNYTATANQLIPVDTTSGNVTVTLPTAPADKTRIVVKHVVQGGSNTVTVARGGSSDVFNKASGSTSLTLTYLNQAVTVQYKASGGIWYVVSDDIPASALTGTFARVVNGELRSQLKADGTDESTAFLAELTALNTAGGGTWLLPHGTIRLNSQIVFPNDGAAQPRQSPIVMQGFGARADGQWAGLDTALGGTVLDLRYSGSDAKVVTLGRGLLKVRGVTFADLGTSTTPFLLTTNTTLDVQDDVAFVGNPSKSRATCDQDAIVLGGTTTTVGNITSSAFQGYGTIIRGVKFSRIRRGVHLRTYANSCIVKDSTFDALCGSDNTAAAIHCNAAAGFVSANSIKDNTIEMTGYVYGIRFTGANGNFMAGNSFWDSAGHSALACVYYESGSADNKIDSLFNDNSALPDVLDATTTPSNVYNRVIGFGTDNFGFGYRALATGQKGTLSGSANNAFGKAALQALTSGANNSAVGASALQSLTTGSANNAVGANALGVLTTGGSNNAVGSSALAALTTGVNNTAVGHIAGWKLTTGGYNVASGYQALSTATTASVNTAVGYNALAGATTTSNCVAVGGEAGNDTNPVTSGRFQTFVGYKASQSTASVIEQATALGYQAKVGGNASLAVGAGASASADGSVAIGTDSGAAGASATTNNTIVLGTANHTTRIPGLPAFVSGDKYLVVDSSGNIHKSSLGPAS